MYLYLLICLVLIDKVYYSEASNQYPVPEFKVDFERRNTFARISDTYVLDIADIIDPTLYGPLTFSASMGSDTDQNMIEHFSYHLSPTSTKLTFTTILNDDAMFPKVAPLVLKATNRDGNFKEMFIFYVIAPKPPTSAPSKFPTASPTKGPTVYVFPRPEFKVSTLERSIYRQIQDNYDINVIDIIDPVKYGHLTFTLNLLSPSEQLKKDLWFHFDVTGTKLTIQTRLTAGAKTTAIFYLTATNHQGNDNYLTIIYQITPMPPTLAPSESPTKRPTKRPTENPTKRPTANPTKRPTSNPTIYIYDTPVFIKNMQYETIQPGDNVVNIIRAQEYLDQTKDYGKLTFSVITVPGDNGDWFKFSELSPGLWIFTTNTGKITYGSKKATLVATNQQGAQDYSPIVFKFATPAPTNSPTKRPTKRPTTNPTKSPTHRPTTSPTSATKTPTTSPTIYIYPTPRFIEDFQSEDVKFGDSYHLLLDEKKLLVSPLVYGKVTFEIDPLKETDHDWYSILTIPSQIPGSADGKLLVVTPQLKDIGNHKIALVAKNHQGATKQKILEFKFGTKSPTKRPTTNPTKSPTKRPTTNPTKSPTKRPTTNPTKRPTTSPTDSPTKSPTIYMYPLPIFAKTFEMKTIKIDDYDIVPIIPSEMLQPWFDYGNLTWSVNSNPDGEGDWYLFSGLNGVYVLTVVPNVNTAGIHTVNLRATNHQNRYSETPIKYFFMPPTQSPTPNPTTSPTKKPTDKPTNTPTSATKTPTVSPTKKPTTNPTTSPTNRPTNSPTIFLYDTPVITQLFDTKTLAIDEADAVVISEALTLDNTKDYGGEVTFEIDPMDEKDTTWYKWQHIGTTYFLLVDTNKQTQFIGQHKIKLIAKNHQGATAFKYIVYNFVASKPSTTAI